MDTPLPKPNAHVPFLPTYRRARVFLTTIEGYAKRVLTGMHSTIMEHVGTPQENRDWSVPGMWIPEILSDVERELATRLWDKSEGQINPRHITGLWLMCSSYGLCAPDNRDLLQITEMGRDFLENEEGEAVIHIDNSEGLLELLTIVAEYGPGKRSDFLPPFAEFTRANSRVQAAATIRSRWYYLMLNLVDRGLIRQDSNQYSVESKGTAYLERVDAMLGTGQAVTTKTLNELQRLQSRHQAEVRETLLQTLRDINPYQLEHIVKSLLQEMGYENVEVTKRSNDLGIDVVGEISIGISNIREVVQVKRHQGNIQRPVVDNLRGSLHRPKAIRGTIITTGKFSQGAKDAAIEPGVAPITLIDGQHLVDLLIEHEVGVEKDMIPILKLRLEDFAPEEETALIDARMEEALGSE